MIRFELIGMRDAEGRFARWETSLVAAQRQRLQEVAEDLIEDLRTAAPRSEGNGEHVADGITFRFRGAREGVTGEIIAAGPRANVLQFIINGTPPHIIRARSGRALAWQATNENYGPPGNGGFYFFGAVNHPGTKPNPFVQRVWAQRQDEVTRRLAQVARDVVTK